VYSFILVPLTYVFFLRGFRDTVDKQIFHLSEPTRLSFLRLGRAHSFPSVSIVVFVPRIRLVLELVERIRQRHLSRNAVLIHVTEMFVLQTVDVPLAAPQHFEKRRYPRANCGAWPARRDVDYPDEANENVGDDSQVVEGNMA